MDEDEDLLLKLSGGNQVSYGQVFGWATDIVVGFPGLRKDLRVNTYDFSKNRLFPDFPEPPPGIKYMRSTKGTLKSLEAFVFDKETKIKLPNYVEVFVLTKRKVSIKASANNGDTTFVTSVTVGDETGICDLTMFNDAIESIFNYIEIGDNLLVGGGWLQSRIVTPNHCGSIIPSKMLLLMEIKVNVFDARKIFIVKDNISSSLPNVFRLLLNKDGNFEKQWTATDILSECNDAILFSSPNPLSQIEDLNKMWDKHIANIDIIGVIKHAGRLERKAKWREKTHIMCKINSRVSKDNDALHLSSGDNCMYAFQEYSAFRWLEIIDILSPTSKPIRVQIFLNDMKTWKIQSSLSPGSLLVITHCFPRMSFLGKYLRTSAYSEIFTGKISDYWKRMPKTYFNSVKPYMSADNWTNLVKASTFTIGGTYLQTIQNKELFAECKPNEEDLLTSLPYPQKVFLSCEVQRIVFTGRITNGFEIGKNFNHTIASEFAARGPDITLTPLISYETFLLWSCRRKLPKISVEGLSTPKEVIQRLSETYKEHTQNICSTKSKAILKASADLELLENLSYYLLEIKDEVNNWLYYAFWFGQSKTEMENRLQNSKGKNVDIMIDIQLISSHSMLKKDSTHEYEVIVQDFDIVN